eukprot:2791569-Rhodomonas_salina.1
MTQLPGYPGTPLVTVSEETRARATVTHQEFTVSDSRRRIPARHDFGFASTPQGPVNRGTPGTRVPGSLESKKAPRVPR